MYEPQACIRKCFRKQFILFMEIVTHYKDINFWNHILFGICIHLYLFMVILFEKTDIKNAIKCVSMKKKIANELWMRMTRNHFNLVIMTSTLCFFYLFLLHIMWFLFSRIITDQITWIIVKSKLFRQPTKSTFRFQFVSNQSQHIDIIVFFWRLCKKS